MRDTIEEAGQPVFMGLTYWVCSSLIEQQGFVECLLLNVSRLAMHNASN